MFKGQLVEAGSLLHHVGPGDQTLTIWLGTWLMHLANL